MIKEPKNIKEVNENLIELKSMLVRKKEKLSQIHKAFHEKEIKTPISEIKGTETEIQQLEELISIARLQKQNLMYDDKVALLEVKIKMQQKEISKLKSKLINT